MKYSSDFSDQIKLCLESVDKRKIMDVVKSDHMHLEATLMTQLVFSSRLTSHSFPTAPEGAIQANKSAH